jgi:cytochrome c-type biogenesis protein CcmH
MSPRDWFWFLAGALVTVAVTVALRPWLRQRPAQPVSTGIPPFAMPVAAALALVGVALGIYFLIGSPQSIASAAGNAPGQDAPAQPPDHAMSGQSAANAGSLDEVTRKLATRLATQGGSDSEWQLLAESYEYAGKTAEAKAARSHKVESANAPTAGNFDSQTMAAVADAFDAPANGAAPNGAAQATPAAVSGTIDLAPKLAPHAQSGATLFIYAKQPNTPGPPLAVVRLRADHWPVKFTLSDANAMVPGHNLSSAQTVQIEARISRNGDALPQSGDLVGTVTSVSPRDGHPVKISIDREIG